MHYDGMFGGNAPTRIDPSKLSIVTEFQTSLFGFIPYSVFKQYSGIDFWEYMNTANSENGCGK